MRLHIQRVSRAQVEIEGTVFSAIGKGLLVLLGVTHNDSSELIPKLCKKLIELRIFNDSQGKMNLSVRDIGGEILVVSQFTLYADCRRGRRPDFLQAAPPEQANALYEEFVKELSGYEIPVKTGVFAADMQVGLVNDGPVTLLLDSSEL
jgi:D-tyrosyl-tRNA(Tyr) deacylase